MSERPEPIIDSKELVSFVAFRLKRPNTWRFLEEEQDV